LEEAGTIRVVAIERTSSDPALLLAFRHWMRRQRGACESTLDNYRIHIRELLTRVGEDPVTLDARSVRAFVMEGNDTCGWAAKKGTTALRMFLRFLIADGKCATGLDGADSRPGALASELAPTVPAVGRCGTPDRVVRSRVGGRHP